MSDLTYGLVSVEEMRGMSGLEFFQKLMSGELPHAPMAKLMGMRLVEVTEGKVAWEAIVPEDAINPMGGVHGGFAMSVLDSALGCAVHSALPAGRGYTTIEAKINLTRPMPKGEVLRCEGKIVTIGRRVGTSEATMTDAQGRVVAFGTSSLLIFDL